MTAPTIEGVFVHPRGCPVCSGRRLVLLSTLYPHGCGRMPRRLSIPVACPQCTDPDELVAHLPAVPSPGGGDAA